MPSDRSTNPIFGAQPFKLGLFCYLHDGGMTMTKAPGRWRARWDDVIKLAKMADRAGLDFMLPISSWRGWKGEIDHRVWCYETLTHAAALSGVTERIALFSTVHAPLVHPVFAAKALATIDHASGGRAGLNIVCGWQTGDFKMFGVEQLEHDRRYDHGLEWFEILKGLLAGPGEPYDYKGEFFNLEGLMGQPGSLQRPHPAIFSAAYSPAGRNYAIKTSDYLLTVFSSFEKAADEVDDIRSREKEIGRKEPLGVIGTAALVCRESRKEAEEFNRYYALEQADRKAVEMFTDTRSKMAALPSAGSAEKEFMRAAGGGSLVGTPEDIVDGFIKMHKAGFAGATMQFFNFTEELPFVIERVLPLMVEAGLRVEVDLAAA